MDTSESLTATEFFERERDKLPQIIILDTRQQYTKELGRHILDLSEAPAATPTTDDLFATIEYIIKRLGPGCFSTSNEEDRAVGLASTLPPDLKVFFLTKLKPLVSGETNMRVIDACLGSFAND